MGYIIIASSTRYVKSDDQGYSQCSSIVIITNMFLLPSSMLGVACQSD